MTRRKLTIKLSSDRRAGIRAAVRTGFGSKTYRGEVLVFETPAAFFGKLTGKRWEMIRALQGEGVVSIRELARRVERDFKRVHEDVSTLIELGLFEREEHGVVCPFDRIHVDLELKAAA